MPMTLNFCDVGHGACAGIICPNGKLIVVDTGHNTSPHWRPSNDLAQWNLQVELLVLTNLDEDHLSDFDAVNAIGVPNFYITNWSVTPALLNIMKGGEHLMGPGTKAVTSILGPTQNVAHNPLTFPDLGGVTIRTFFNNCPADFVDTNNLSCAVFVSYAGHKIIFPGDLEKAGWLKLLERPEFHAELAGVTTFVASHHGRESGYCEEVFNYTPNLTVVLFSDSSIQHETQKTAGLYANHARGFEYDGQFREVLTTRQDGHIRITFGEDSIARVMMAKAA